MLFNRDAFFFLSLKTLYPLSLSLSPSSIASLLYFLILLWLKPSANLVSFWGKFGGEVKRGKIIEFFCAAVQ